MIKRTFIIFMCIMCTIAITNVKALSYDDIIIPETKMLDILFKEKFNENFEELVVKKYTSEGLNIYKVRNEREGAGTISVFDKEEDVRILRIIKEGSKIDEMKILTEDDKYMASKMAIDCIINGYSTDEDSEKNYKNYYQVVEDESKKERAVNIIAAVR